MTELVVASALGAFLMTLVATTWTNLGVPALEVAARARIEQEGILTAQSLACDLGGFLADLPGRTGAMQTGVANPYQASGTPPWNTSNPGVLLLNFTGASQADVIVITYQLEGSQLVRTNSSTGVSTTVASYVTAFSASAATGQHELSGDHTHYRLPEFHEHLHPDRVPPHAPDSKSPTSPRLLPDDRARHRDAPVRHLELRHVHDLGLVRIETNRVLQQVRDQGAMNALARAIQLLQYSKPSDTNNPGRRMFTYAVTLSTQDPSGACTSSAYTVIYTARPTWGPSAGRSRSRRARRPSRCRISAIARNGREPGRSSPGRGIRGRGPEPRGCGSIRAAPASFGVGCFFQPLPVEGCPGPKESGFSRVCRFPASSPEVRLAWAKCISASSRRPSALRTVPR